MIARLALGEKTLATAAYDTASRDCWIASLFCFLFMLFHSSSGMLRGLVLRADGLALCSTGRGGSMLVDEELGSPGDRQVDLPVLVVDDDRR